MKHESALGNSLSLRTNSDEFPTVYDYQISDFEEAPEIWQVYKKEHCK